MNYQITHTHTLQQQQQQNTVTLPDNVKAIYLSFQKFTYLLIAHCQIVKLVKVIQTLNHLSSHADINNDTDAHDQY